MRVLEGLKPERVFYYFEELTRIPRGSYHTDEVSAYCENVAAKLGLKCRRDKLNNVTIVKPASPGYEKAPGVIIQGHLDMVNEKTADSPHDFDRDPLKLRIEGDWIWATDTTLGGDDGIAIALALAILEDQALEHPRLECLFTTEEEVGMDGALGYDYTGLSGMRLLNLDSEEEGIFLTSCAGGAHCQLSLPVRRIPSEGSVVTLTVSGLLGGHSGVEINKGRGNANILLGYVLNRLNENVSFGLISVDGGSKDNAIPREAKAVMMVDAGQLSEMKQCVNELEKALRGDYSGVDEGISLILSDPEERQTSFLHPEDQRKLLFFLMQIPSGVQSMSAYIPGLVETSLNPGILKTDEDQVTISVSVRSSVEHRRRMVCEKLKSLITFIGGTFVLSGEYPAWEYRADSPLRDLMTSVYEEMYGKKPEIQAIHAGLECGLFAKKMPGLDMASMGPDMREIHTPQEHLSISSVQRVWEYLVELLRRMK